MLVEAAAVARHAAYAPYSGFQVGAALLAEDGSVYTGCNVENASFGLTCCAERVALFRAIAEGRRSFRAIAVVTPNAVTPCGACRQVLAEFSPRMQVIVSDGRRHSRTYGLADLLPASFSPADLPETGQ
jgi:cytidine deaminase